MTAIAPTPVVPTALRTLEPTLRSSERRSSQPSSPQWRGRRRDVQGLRALAVVAVVADHVLGRPSGGFLGVDIFFVISGFLITGLLLREFRTHGRLDLLGFYKRRIKRTMPVAWLVIIVTLIAGSFVLPTYGLNQLRTAAVSAGAFWSNWQLISVGTDYLHATDAPTAVQHYWSLAVEEQFYLVWPAALLGVLLLARRFRARWLLPILLTVLALGSLVWAAHESTAHPTAAYFSTFTRGWELLAGAGLAFAARWLEHIPHALRPWMAWSGLAVLLGGLFTVTPDFAFPYPWALLAVAGTVLVIGAGTGASDTQVWPLTNGLSQSIGSISYSVYLWHFPVTVFASALHPNPGRIVHLIEVVLIVLLSVLSYHLIEVPFRQRAWRRPALTLPSARWILAATAGATASALLIGALVGSRHVEQPTAVSTAGYFDAPSTPAQTVRSKLIDSALRAEAWPKLVPSDDELGEAAFVPEWTKDGCLNGFGPEETARRCVFGDKSADRTVVLYGDSVALSYLPGLRAALEGRGWRIEVLTNGQCPAIAVPVTLGDATPYPQCDDYHRFALEKIARERPALVIAVSSYLSLDRLAVDGPDANPTEVWTTGTRDTMRRLAASAGRVLVLDAPPLEYSPQSCKTGLSSPTDCIIGVPSNWKVAADAQHAGVRAAGEENVSYPSTLPWFCSRAGLCPSFLGDVVTLADGMHFTDAGSRQLAPLIRGAVADAIR